MKNSIQTKLLVMFIGVVILTTSSISVGYYIITRQDERIESQEHIQIAFDLILTELTNRVKTYTESVQEFLKENVTILWASYNYSLDASEAGTIRFLFEHFPDVIHELRQFGRVALADRVSLYGANQRLLVVYQRADGQESWGGYLESEDEGKVYLPMDDPSVQAEITFRRNNLSIGVKNALFESIPMPSGVNAYYESDPPQDVSIQFFREEQSLGLRIAVPIYRRKEIIAILVGDIFYTQPMVEEFAALSRTDVNFFAGSDLSIGTLKQQQTLNQEMLRQTVSCHDLLNRNGELRINPLLFGDVTYYQGQCTFKNQEETIGALAISLSQEAEKQEIRESLQSILVIAGIVSAFVVGLVLIFTRKPLYALHDIVRVIAAAADGDLRLTAQAATGDEIESVARNLNQMIAQLRSISGQVQDASLTVNATADSIFRQMETLVQHMTQQSGSVVNVTGSMEKISHFIDAVALNTTDLLQDSAKNLTAIQETQAQIREVSTSSDSLTTNLHLISSAIDQTNRSVKQISENTRQLVHIVNQTESDIQQIDTSFHDVARNAERTQHLAKDTMDAALRGQSSVNASIEGMTDLKEVVMKTARVIQEVNSWGEQVSSILDIVDEITEQTSLLALNASIISAQAGMHGRGFAVVADEIKNLAVRTKTSTREIGTLIEQLQRKTGEGVVYTEQGLEQAEQSMRLATAVKDDLTTILERATRSSNRATDTVQVLQDSAESTQRISASIRQVTEMTSQIGVSLQEQEGDTEQVVAAVGNLRDMSEQLHHAVSEQQAAADQIADRMEKATDRFSAIADQTEELTQSSHHIVKAMRTIDGTAEETLLSAKEISGTTVNDLLRQSELLRKIVNIFKLD